MFLVIYVRNPDDHVIKHFILEKYIYIFSYMEIVFIRGNTLPIYVHHFKLEIVSAIPVLNDDKWKQQK